jgi:hypothetical protein
VPEHLVSQTGDLWVLGRHRLLCGDSTVATNVERVLGGVEPHLMVTDPPYAVLGISESEYVARFTSPTQTDWVMRCTPRKVLRVAEQEPVVLPPAKAKRAA